MAPYRTVGVLTPPVSLKLLIEQQWLLFALQMRGPARTPFNEHVGQFGYALYGTINRRFMTSSRDDRGLTVNVFHMEAKCSTIISLEGMYVRGSTVMQRM